MSHHQLVTRYWILAISTNYGCECNRDFSTVTTGGAKHLRRDLHRSVISCRQSTTSPIVMKDVCGQDR